jgi:hypothetical protein
VVILDNVDDAKVLTSPRVKGEAEAAEVEIGSLRQLLSYIPHCQHGSVLITSRTRSAALELVEDADIITVERMNVEDAVTLFQRKLRRPEADDEVELVTSLVTSLEQMPLAIVQAAAYILQRWPRCSIQQYLDDYQPSDQKKTGLLSYEGGQLRRDGTAKNSILITWQLSFDYAAAINLVENWERGNVRPYVTSHPPCRAKIQVLCLQNSLSFTHIIKIT